MAWTDAMDAEWHRLVRTEFLQTITAQELCRLNELQAQRVAELAPQTPWQRENTRLQDAVADALRDVADASKALGDHQHRGR